MEQHHSPSEHGNEIPGMTSSWKGPDSALEESWRCNREKRCQALKEATGIDFIKLGSESLTRSSISTNLDSWFVNQSTRPDAVGVERLRRDIRRTQKKEVVETKIQIKAEVLALQDAAKKRKAEAKKSKAEAKKSKAEAKKSKADEPEEDEPKAQRSKPQIGKKQENIRSRKVKIFLQKEQTPIFMKYLNHYRFTGNLAIEKSKEHGYESDLNMSALRTSLVTDASLPEDRKFLKETPYAIRAAAVLEVCAHHKAEVTKNKKFGFIALRKVQYQLKDNISKRDNAKTLKTKDKYQVLIDEIQKKLDAGAYKYSPNLRFKKQKDIRSVMEIGKDSCKVTADGVISIYPGILKKLGTLKTKEKIDFGINIDPQTGEISLQHSIKMSFDKVTGWHLIIPYDASTDVKLKALSEPTGIKKSDVTSSDPGYRDFHTVVDSDGFIKEYGVGWYNTLKPKLNRLDKFQAKLSFYSAVSRNKNLTYKERQRARVLSLRTKKIVRKAETKIRNMIDYMHKKIARQMLDETDTILLPKINAKSLLKGDLCSEVKRMIGLGAHCIFHDYISFQAGGSVINVCERYTTKTCASCFSRYEIGSSKIYECKTCGYSADRDVNAAINILVKNIED
jgi:transposase